MLLFPFIFFLFLLLLVFHYLQTFTTCQYSCPTTWFNRFFSYGQRKKQDKGDDVVLTVTDKVLERDWKILTKKLVKALKRPSKVLGEVWQELDEMLVEVWSESGEMLGV